MLDPDEDSVTTEISLVLQCTIRKYIYLEHAVTKLFVII